MPSISNGYHKSNGRVSPMDDATIEKMAEQEINNTNVIVNGDPVQPSKEVVNKNFLYRFFKRDKKEQNIKPNKKPQGPKLKTFEIVCFFFLIFDSIHLCIFSVSIC